MAHPSTGPPNVEELQSAVQSSSVPLNPSNVNHYSSSIHLTASSQSWFPNSSNFEVKDSQFTSIANANVTINNDPVSTILWSHVAAGAIFNSAARYAAGKCHPGTRKKIISRIVDWINDPDPTKSVLWIYGPAGAGKSAIAQTICELLKESHPNHDGGSFFFSSGPTDCGNALKLFTTLSYQLAIQYPSIRAEINNVLSRDPSLPTKSMEIQLLSLIVQPLLRCRTFLSHIPVLIIDGLDECANEKGTTQGGIIRLIAKCVVEYNTPLRFMILSRPEYWIRDAFEMVPLPNSTLSFSLRHDSETDEDIRVYLTDEFERIRVESRRFMSSVIPPWPPAETIDHLVYQASGQYIYPAIVLKFVGNPSKFSNPQKQLEIILSPGPHRALAFSELDTLYATILSAYPKWETMRRVLAALLLEANAAIITAFLGIDPDELVLVLDALGSLIMLKKPSPNFQRFWESVFGPLQDGLDQITFCHRSFNEFFHDSTRSGPFFIDLDLETVANEIVDGYFDMIHRNLDQNYKTEPYIFFKIDIATYPFIMQDTAIRSTLHCTASMLLPLISRLTTKLELFDTSRLAHMHSVFYFIYDMEYFRFALHDLFHDRPLEHHNAKENTETLTELQTAYQNLEKVINRACESAFSALASCTDFEVTPTLVYLTEYWFYNDSLPLDGLRTIAGVADVMSSLKQHHYLLLYTYRGGSSDSGIWSPIGSSLFWNNTGSGWRTEGIWGDLRISFTHEVLKSIFTTREVFRDDSRYIAVARFFDSRSISDIGNGEYFQNSSNLAILGMIADLETWIGLLDTRFFFLPMHFLISTLSWFNRQLTNPQTVALLQNYNKTIQQTMITVMKYILEHGFLKYFTEFYKNGFHAFAPGSDSQGKNTRSTEIKVWPLPEGFYEEGSKSDIYLAGSLWDPDHWQIFHCQLFGEMEGNIKAAIDPIIHPSQWRPYLVTPLLKALVNFFYGQIRPEFSAKFYEKSLPVLTQCIPYAHPTPENLRALRALVYLYPQVTPAWNAPEGLWLLLAEFIQKYNRSILSLEEKRLFLLWLNSEEKADIKTYIGQISIMSPSLEGNRETESTDLDGEGEGNIESL